VDVVRHPLVARIVRAYEARDAARDAVRALRDAAQGAQDGTGDAPGTSG
jgi:hypothetical protein